MLEMNKSDKQKIKLTNKYVTKFINRYGKIISNIVIENKGDALFAKKITACVILEIYFRIKYDHYDERADNSLLISKIALNVVANLNAKDSRSNAKKIDTIDQNPEEYKLVVNQNNINFETIEEALKKVGEPGRTALKLSFFDCASDEKITDHIQADSINDMNKKRVRFLDKCVSLLESNG